jgi:hypothetical protein
VSHKLEEPCYGQKIEKAVHVPDKEDIEFIPVLLIGINLDFSLIGFQGLVVGIRLHSITNQFVGGNILIELGF